MRLIDLALLLPMAFLESVVAADALEQPSSGLPIWSIALIGIIVGILVLLVSSFMLRRRLLNKRALNNMAQIEKHHHDTIVTDSSLTMDDTFSKRTTQVYKPTMIDQDKLALPLPPPSTSLFSDKMELNSDDAMQLFERYMQSEKQTKGGFSTIDLDMPQQLVNTVQQKMGTIKCNLRQSLRRQKSKARATPGDAAPLHQMFDTPRQSVNTPQKSSPEMDQDTIAVITPTVNIEKDTTLLPDQVDHQSTLPLPAYDINGSTISATTTSSSSSTSPSPLHLSTSTKSPLLAPPVLSSNISLSSSSSSSGSPPPNKMPPTPPMPTLATECTNETSAIDAARHVIRSASRKSKTRSTLIGDDALLKMFNRNDMMPDLDERHSDSNHHSAYTAMSGFTTVSGRSTKPGGASTRYLTNDILVRRASTLGRSHQNSQQQQQQQQQRKKSRLNGLFDTPSNDIMVPANEKVEVTQVFDLAEKQGTTLDMRKDNSANYSPPHNTLLHQPALSTINTEQRGSNDLEDSKLVQDRMNSFEGGNCRKSNGSVATMVRISQQHSQTWSGRTPPKRSSIPQQQTTDEQRMVDNLSPISEKSGQTSTTPFSTIGRSKQQRLSGWYEDTYQNKTPAEMERDHYLKTLYGTENDNLSGQR